MNEIKLSVEDKNLETVLTVLNSFNSGLISKIEIAPKEAVRACDVPNNTKVTENYYTPASTLDRIDVEEKRKKLFSFAFITLILLSITAVYFEVYDQTHVPPFLRVILAAYWSYSLVGIIVSKRGSDYWVSKLYFNVSK
ncbi:hypothetical protein SMGD1_1472 [Sulfurimonas gotlandica GD1]|jgi:hypothetical protein|uniref:Uncharacterized protein n=1 Tax=Sulfurimonas gotlandica (strain DSM 19862 / JCM 16533 / GD1) TaxID=929558 RepID=H1FT77_SULGG|nr:hypothetical protein [Sulfurimonas gotlandica]EHP29996.1 hypothetical protein SMGD1_1472 [Sulfurimonas gotlandica GD1]